MMNTALGKQLFEKSKEIIPGGVNSPVRAFGSVGGTPIFMKRAKGAWMYDAENRAYLDLINSWGPMILGHAHEKVVERVTQKLQDGFSFGTPTEQEYFIAKQIQKMAPHIEMVRLVNSGTEACLSALRLARGYTGKKYFIKFAGCYHGHADPFLVKAGSGVLSFGIPGSAGVPEAVTSHTLLAEFNDIEGVKKLFKAYGHDMAAVMVEPIAGNMGCILPNEGFLEELRLLCNENQSVLIFDEVMTGFRLAKGGAAEVTGVIPDLTTYGKVIGGGMPVGAFGGKKEIMEQLAPLGTVYQAGTLSGNPIAVCCGLTTLEILENQPEIYLQINAAAEKIENSLRNHFSRFDVPFAINRKGSMLSIHFGTERVENYSDALSSKNSLFNEFFHHMLKYGVYLPPSAFEAWFISSEIKDNELLHFENALSLFSPEI